MGRHLQAFSHPSSAILTLHSRSAVISTIDHSKTSRSRRNERPTPPIMKNERHQPNNPTETRTILSRTQIAKLHSHLASNDSTGYRNPKSLSTAAAKIPRRSGFPKGSGEVLERDRGSKSPVSFQPPPRGINKIYRSDVVFLMEESKTNDISQPQLPFTPPRKNAIAPRRRRMAPSSRSRTIFLGNGSLTLGRTWTCTNSTHHQSPHKSFAELFQKRPSPRYPRSPRFPNYLSSPKGKRCPSR